MARKKQRQERRSSRRFVDNFHDFEDEDHLPPVKKAKAPLEPLNDAQRRYMNMIRGKTIVFGMGPAGTGKSFVSAGMAADAIAAKEITKIIVTRPAIEAGRGLGFLPGEMEEKYAPYFQPVKNIFEQRLGSGELKYHMSKKSIEPLPLEFMRGLSFDNCWIIADEMQNASPEQMKMLMTRLGKNSKLIINGDAAQKDIPGPCGLNDAQQKTRNIDAVGVMKFTRDDVVRSDIVQEVLEAYELEKASEEDDAGLQRMFSKAA